MKDEIFISVDIEADGSIPGDYSMTEIGACVVGDTRETFEALIKPISEKISLQAAGVSQHSREWLQQNGEEPAAAMMRFAKWVAKVSGDARPVFVGFNAPFDWMFIHWYCMHFLGENPFGYSALDLKAYYMGKCGVDLWAETSMSKLPPRFAPKRSLSHLALDDAIQQAEIFSKLRTM
jgi:ribonuclease T